MSIRILATAVGYAARLVQPKPAEKPTREPSLAEISEQVKERGRSALPPGYTMAPSFWGRVSVRKSLTLG